MFNGVFIIRLVGWGVYCDWEWDIFVYCEEVIRAGTWDVEEDEDIIFDSDIGCVNLEKVLRLVSEERVC